MIDLDRWIVQDGPPQDALGVVTGSWQDGEGRLAVIRQTGPKT
jgi:hypothetical protein